jgi:hypothetical protein
MDNKFPMRKTKVNYKIQVWKKAGTYYGQIRELSILVRDDDPAILLSKVEEARKELAQAYTEAELGDHELAQPIGAETQRRWQGLSWFAAKAVVVTFAASILIVVTLSQAANSVSGVVIGAFEATGGPNAVVGKLARYIEGFPAERRSKTRQDLEIIVKALLPYAETIHPLFIPAYNSTCTRPDVTAR